MSSLFATIKHRRSVLRQHFDVVREFEALEESCVPSYVHANPAAAAVSWMRLAAAAKLYRQKAPSGPILDFGAATGEIHHLLKPVPTDYHFIEGSPVLAAALTAFLPHAVQETEIAAGAYATIFALDSLEHNDDYAEILGRLAEGLAPGGVLILSGPTESWLYRLGRRIAGFSGHYHKTTIYDIEAAAERVLKPVARKSLPLPGLSLFRISAWTKRSNQ